MKISVIGCGYLGAVHAVCMASLGHDVVGIDVSAERIAQLSRGDAPFYEPGFEPMLAEQLAAGRLSFSTDYTHTADCSVHFIGVGTPQQPGGNGADLSYLHAAIDSVVAVLAGRDSSQVLVVGKSTVPVGTAEDVRRRVADAGVSARVVWNPEFLREGHAVNDTLRPDRLVYGTAAHGDDAAAAAVAHLDEVYREILDRGTPRITTTYATAELVKVAANSFLATKVSFINAMVEMCEAVDADVLTLADCLGRDERIGPHFLRAGVGFGGGCLPKDIRAFMARAGELGVDHALTFLREIDAINARRRETAVELAVRSLGGDLRGRKIAVLGAAFKPHSDDLRDSPAMDVAMRLLGLGAGVVVTDPIALAGVHRRYPHVPTAPDARSAATDADLTMLMTEWPQYAGLRPEDMSGVVRDKTFIDGRNVLDPQEWRAAGWRFTAMGRGRPCW